MASTSSAPFAAAPSSVDANTQSQAPPRDDFLRPASPRKRRRTPDAPDPRSLEGQVQAKLTVSPVALTGAQEMAEQKRRKFEHQLDHQTGTGQLVSPNPGHQALGALRGGASRNMTKAVDAPQSTASTTPATSAPEANTSGSAQTSPVSNSSFNTGTSATAGGPRVASPGQIGEQDNGEDAHVGEESGNVQPASPKAYTYPDPRLTAAEANNHANRNNSIAGTGDGARSPAGSNKKHKCPYCDTEFTRHHNLKSHLLTHSQEKPYLCQQCDMRFRRLHDLKRHTKLHTGERPHVCPICNRKFARGDALARHTKGAGGCAGHRASVGSFTNEAMGEGVMDTDMMYAGAESQEPDQMDESDGSGRPLRPSHYGNNLQAPSANSLPQTYPPVAQRTGPYLRAPPPPNHSGNASPSSQNPSYGHQGQQPSYPPFHGNMTESPGPISPSGGPHNPRRSSVNTQLSQYARQSTTHPHGSPQAPTANMGLPPPAQVPSNAPPASGSYSHLPPPLPSITTSDPRNSTAHGHTHNPSGSYASAPGSASTHNSLSSHGQGSGERAGLGLDEKDRLFAMLHTLNSTIEGLRSEVTGLKGRIEGLEKEKAQASNAAPAHN